MDRLLAEVGDNSGEQLNRACAGDGQPAKTGGGGVDWSAASRVRQVRANSMTWKSRLTRSQRLGGARRQTVNRTGPHKIASTLPKIKSYRHCLQHRTRHAIISQYPPSILLGSVERRATMPCKAKLDDCCPRTWGCSDAYAVRGITACVPRRAPAIGLLTDLSSPFRPPAGHRVGRQSDGSQTPNAST